MNSKEPRSQIILFSILVLFVSLLLASQTDVKAQTSFDCSFVTEIPQVECEALVALYNSTNGDNWNRNDNWFDPTKVCWTGDDRGWYGVICSGGHVVWLNMLGNGLVGNIPPEIGSLTSVNMVALHQNALSGEIPPEICNMTSLVRLFLDHNQLTGTIPPCLGNLPNLWFIALQVNELEGEIPPELGNLPNLGYLWLRDNHLQGEIPEELGNLTKLFSFIVDYNRNLSGPLPASLTNIPNLDSLWFHNTAVCEPVEPEFQNWIATVRDVDRSNIYCIPLNQPPTADAEGPYNGSEGTAVPLDGSTSADPDGDVLAYSWVVDSSLCSFDDPTSVNPNLTCTDNGSFTVTLTVDDGQESDGADAIVTIDNVAPTAVFNAPLSITEGSDINLSLADVYDPSSVDTAAGFEFAFDCGDGSGYGVFSSSSSAICLTTDNGFPLVKAKVRDKDGGETEYQSTVTVTNVAPTVGPISTTVILLPVDTLFNTSADFSDPGTADTHTAVWDWGDETTSAGSVTQGAGFGSVSDSHAYSTAGVHTITLTVTDDDGDSGTSTYQYIVVYDPEGGFVTGGGWIDSPAGAYLPDPDLSGKATFGFVSKYKKGATVPTGNTEFQFKVAGLNFHSSSYDWLVVTGDDFARFKGTGTINGMGEYKFMIWAGDGETDTFRIRIWEEDEFGVETVIYDNGFEQALGGGSIVVHTGKQTKSCLIEREGAFCSLSLFLINREKSFIPASSTTHTHLPDRGCLPLRPTARRLRR